MDKRKHFAIRISYLLIILMLWSVYCTLKEVPSVQPSAIGQPSVQPPPKPAKIALVLGAGSSKGFAHVGVLKVLETNKVPIHMVIGTSVGSAVGSLYAYGYNAFQLQKISFSIEKGDIVDLIIPDKNFGDPGP